MTTRQQRRQAERKARKTANKAESKQPFTAVPVMVPTAAPLGVEPQFPRPEYAAIQRAETNRANAQHSTGPRTAEGKAASSQNNFRHGLTGHFAVLPWEDIDRFVELSAQLHEEHQPATMTEYLLVENMAQHQWLAQRALHLQNLCFNMDVPLCEQEKLLSLYLRYGTTHNRAFHKCLSDLLKLRAQKAKEERGFESQERQAAAETRKAELHQAKITALQAKAKPAAPAKPIPHAPSALEPLGFVPQNTKYCAPEPRSVAA